MKSAIALSLLALSFSSVSFAQMLGGTKMTCQLNKMLPQQSENHPGFELIFHKEVNATSMEAILLGSYEGKDYEVAVFDLEGENQEVMLVVRNSEGKTVVSSAMALGSPFVSLVMLQDGPNMLFQCAQVSAE